MKQVEVFKGGVVKKAPIICEHLFLNPEFEEQDYFSFPVNAERYQVVFSMNLHGKQPRKRNNMFGALKIIVGLGRPHPDPVKVLQMCGFEPRNVEEIIEASGYSVEEGVSFKVWAFMSSTAPIEVAEIFNANCARVDNMHGSPPMPVIGSNKEQSVFDLIAPAYSETTPIENLDQAIRVAKNVSEGASGGDKQPPSQTSIIFPVDRVQKERKEGDLEEKEGVVIDFPFGIKN